MDHTHPYDSAHTQKAIGTLLKRFPILKMTSLGQSVLGRDIPLLRIGDPRKPTVLYVATHHGMEWITTEVLLSYVEDFCRLAGTERHVYGIRPSCVAENRCLCIVPQLNPDGADLQIHGIPGNDPVRERLLFYNGGNPDFTRWQANARGVDLNHNYNAGFAAYKRLEREKGIFGGAPTRFSGEYPESEPETAALASYIRRHENIRMILTLHTQGEEIYYSSGDCIPPSSARIAALFGRMTGYRPSRPEGMAAYGGLTDWFIQAFNRPAFTFECGRGQNPLPQNKASDIYEAIREALFTAPLLV
ncbi:MAG: M14 family metallocarboxypeptidase [Clostridia bacterium]|nr:M14 family metallocarboxypeptidase [Clostridia bacterium]